MLFTRDPWTEPSSDIIYSKHTTSKGQNKNRSQISTSVKCFACYCSHTPLSFIMLPPFPNQISISVPLPSSVLYHGISHCIMMTFNSLCPSLDYELLKDEDNVHLILQHIPSTWHNVPHIGVNTCLLMNLEWICHSAHKGTCFVLPHSSFISVPLKLETALSSLPLFCWR